MQVTVWFTVELPASADIDRVEELVVVAGREAMVEALALAVRAYEADVGSCPACGGGDLSTEGTDRRSVSATFGRVELRLRRLRCGGCGGRFRPADPLLAQLAGANSTGKLREACVLAGTSWPYQTAARVLGELCGARVSKETVRKLANAAGVGEAERQRDGAERLHAPTGESVRAKAGEPRPDPPEMLEVGLDGGWVPSRDQPGGMEGKVGVVATGSEPVGLGGRRKLAQRRLVATFGPSKELGVLACAAATELGGHGAPRRCVLGDGAGWIKTEAERHFGSAAKILDWPHVWRAVAKAVRAARPGKARKEERRRLYGALRGHLWSGEVGEALAVLAGLRAAEDVAALEQAIGYLRNQRGWIGDYGALRATGYPVGSGLVERQVELVINRRLKKRGMRWLRANADAVVALRVRQLNEDWIGQHREVAA